MGSAVKSTRLLSCVLLRHSTDVHTFLPAGACFSEPAAPLRARAPRGAAVMILVVNLCILTYRQIVDEIFLLKSDVKIRAHARGAVTEPRFSPPATVAYHQICCEVFDILQNGTFWETSGEHAALPGKGTAHECSAGSPVSSRCVEAACAVRLGSAALIIVDRHCS